MMISLLSALQIQYSFMNAVTVLPEPIYYLAYIIKSCDSVIILVFMIISIVEVFSVKF